MVPENKSYYFPAINYAYVSYFDLHYAYRRLKNKLNEIIDKPYDIDGMGTKFLFRKSNTFKSRIYLKNLMNIQNSQFFEIYFRHNFIF